MNQKSSKSTSCKPSSPGQTINWNNLLENIAMEPVEREIYEEHMRAMQEFESKTPVNPRNIPANRLIVEEEECSLDEEDDPKMIDEDEKDERTKQRDQAREDFEEDEEFHAAQFRKLRDWETRKRLALENLEQPIDLASEVMELLMYGTPIQFVNKVADPDVPDMDIATVLALYLTPECIARDQLFVDNETPVSLSLDMSPMGRNVFEIVSGDEAMRGFPITYKSIVFIKVHYNEDNRDFFLSIDISSPYTVGKLYLQDTIDDLCQFQLLSVNKMDNANQELIDITAPVLIRHVKTGFYVMSKVHITVVNICGEEKFVLGSDEIEGNNVLWKLIYGAFNDDLDFDFNNYVRDRWWQPLPPTDYIKPNTSVKDPFFCSKPSTSRDYGAGPSNIQFSRQQVRHSIPETFDAEWIEVQPGLQKSLGPPGAANEFLDNPDELFTTIKKKTPFGRTKKESQQIVLDYLEAVRNHNASSTPPRSNIPPVEPSSWPKPKGPNRKSCVDKVENTIDFMKKLNPKANQSGLVRDNKFARDSFKWPKAPEIGSPSSKPILDNPNKVISAIKKINLQKAEMSPQREPNKLKELFVWPAGNDPCTSAATQDLIRTLETQMDDSDEFEEDVPTKLSKDHDLKPTQGTHLLSGDLQKFYNTDSEHIQLPANFWDFFDSDNTHLMYSKDKSEDDSIDSTAEENSVIDMDLDSKEKSEAESNNSTVIDMELEEEEVPIGAGIRIEAGQGDMGPQPEEPNKDANP